MYTDTNVKKLIINELTKEQYDAAVQAGTINEDELYMVTDENYPSSEEIANSYQPLINSTNKLSAANISGLSTVATSGDYNDLSNKPTIPDAQVQSDWNETNTQSFAYIINKPTIPMNVTDLSDASNYATIASLSNVAFSGDYNDLTNKPTIPTLDSVPTANSVNGVSSGGVYNAIVNMTILVEDYTN